MPGVLTTTSQRARASQPPAPVRRTASPSTEPAAGWSSATTGDSPIDRSLRRLAPPSTPRPHTPTEAPASSDQLILDRVLIRHLVGLVLCEKPGHFGRADGRETGRQALQDLVALAVPALGR